MAHTVMSHDLLTWRRRQKKHAIMTPAEFESIKAKASARGADNPEKVAGAAYWRTARAKFRASKRRRS